MSLLERLLANSKFENRYAATPATSATPGAQSSKSSGCSKVADSEHVGVGVRGDGERVSWDGFVLDDDGGVIIHAPCDGDGCAACEWTGLRRASEVATL